ncbi:MAG: hypothetical protein KAH06_07560 [Desulfobacterales bacterium]|nr:hypothetical protein [Desulfobacterales bacterium]
MTGNLWVKTIGALAVLIRIRNVHADSFEECHKPLKRQYGIIPLGESENYLDSKKALC